MKRIREIIADIRQQRDSCDDFFLDFESSCKNNPSKRRAYRVYNDALMALDDASWGTHKCKAIKHYKNHRAGQLKQGFFNLLNEAFAYRYLVRKGYSDVRFIKENGRHKSPDISFSVSGISNYCEVKTLGISKNEIKRRNIMQVYDSSCYESLDHGFLNKFCTAVNVAREQISACGSAGLVYVIINFDDFTLDYYPNYRRQLVAFSKTHGFDGLFVKVGLHGNKRICMPCRSTGSAK